MVENVDKEEGSKGGNMIGVVTGGPPSFLQKKKRSKRRREVRELRS